MRGGERGWGMSGGGIEGKGMSDVARETEGGVEVGERDGALLASGAATPPIAPTLADPYASLSVNILFSIIAITRPHHRDPQLTW